MPMFAPTFCCLGLLLVSTRAGEVAPFCVGGEVVNSNRTASAACAGAIGDECSYSCNPGFLRIGRHVCQSYTPGGTTAGTDENQNNSNPRRSPGRFLGPRATPTATSTPPPARPAINRTYFGGQCVPLCPASAAPCPAGEVPVRLNATGATGRFCLTTVCRSPEEALGNLTRGAYETFVYARVDATGIYLDHVDPRLPPTAQDRAYAAVDATAAGIVAECVAAGLGYITVAQAQQRVRQSLASFAGEVPGFKMPRHEIGGWFPTFINPVTGASDAPGTYATDSTGFIGAGMMFARTYFRNVDPLSAVTVEIEALVDTLMGSVQWTKLFCENGNRSLTGTGIPWLMQDGPGCSDVAEPGPDGFYEFSELLWQIWMSHHAGCNSTQACPDAAMSDLWAQYNGRRLHPDYSFGGQNLLTLWPSYVTQYPFYMVHPFNSDPVYTAILKAQWLAEWAYYNGSGFYAGDDGRYGLGAGPSATWCSGGQGYIADRMTSLPDMQACRYYSPYAVAGYAPVAPEVITMHLLALLGAAESVAPIQDSVTKQPYEILWRKSLLQRDPLFTCPWGSCGVTLVDFAPEFFGLASLQLGAAFFVDHTDHWPRDPPL